MISSFAWSMTFGSTPWSKAEHLREFLRLTHHLGPVVETVCSLRQGRNLPEQRRIFGFGVVRFAAYSTSAPKANKHIPDERPCPRNISAVTSRDWDCLCNLAWMKNEPLRRQDGTGKSIYAAEVVYDSSADIVQIRYSEGLLIDYCHFEAANISPRYEFGFGLSYTTFLYSTLSVAGSTADGTRQPSGPGSALDPWLHESVITVSFTLTNNGTLRGTEVPQLYTSPPASAVSAPFILKGFDSIFLDAGESQVVSFNLSRYNLSVWDVVSQQWEIPSGVTGISVGASSRDFRLKGSITN